MKKIFIYFICIVAVLISFIIGIEKISDKGELVNNETNGEDLIELPISEVEAASKKQKDGLTQQEAELLCGEVLGDKAEENGFPISYRCIGAVSSGGKYYYVMNISWLVNESHWSYIGNCFVSSNGQEIYDGIVLDGIYEMTKLRWKK